MTLELGGKSAAIVLEDADIDQALPNILAGSFANSGQACVALTRILLPISRYDEIAEKFAAAVAVMKVGDPTDPATVIGPMTSAAQQQRVLDYIGIGEAEGAKILTGGSVPEGLSTAGTSNPRSSATSTTPCGLLARKSSGRSSA